MIEFKYDEDDLCEACGAPLLSHGDVCDPAVLDEVARERTADRIIDMDRDDWEANSD